MSAQPMSRRAIATGELVGAYFAKDYAAMEQALAQGANPDCTVNNAQRTILHDAALNGDIQAMDLVLSWRANPNTPDYENAGPLFCAVRGGHVECVEKLLEAGANPKQTDRHSRRPDYYLRYESSLLNQPNARYIIDGLLEDYRENRPSVNPAKAIDSLKERLFAYNRQGYTPLDNPQTWQQFDAVEDALFAAGTPIEKDDWLSVNGRGERWLDVAIRFRQLGRVLSHLHQQGDVLEMSALVAEDGKATPLLEQIIAKGEVRHLFQVEQFEEGGVHDMRRLRAALPETAIAQVHNFHALQSALSRPSQEREYGLIGR